MGIKMNRVLLTKYNGFSLILGQLPIVPGIPWTQQDSDS